MDTGTVVVLIVGIATVGAQLWATVLGNRAAAKNSEVADGQLRAAEASLRSELQAVVVASRGGYSPDGGKVIVHNGGRYAVIDLSVECLDGDGLKVAAGRTALVQPSSTKVISVDFATADGSRAFERAERVRARWSDGTGQRDETIPLLPVDG
jgi:hypothetical protein